VKLLGLWHMQWLLLDMAIRLDRRWLPWLQQQSDEAVQEALSIAQQLPGLQRKFTSLGEMRTQLLQAIIDTGGSLVDEVGQEPRLERIERHEREAQDLLLIARMLERCLDMRTCRRRFNHKAYRTLLGFLSPGVDYIPLHRGPDLGQQTCSHVLGRVKIWLAEARA
jgi:hypothetical protein